MGRGSNHPNHRSPKSYHSISSDRNLHSPSSPSPHTLSVPSPPIGTPIFLFPFPFSFLFLDIVRHRICRTSTSPSLSWPPLPLVALVPSPLAVRPLGVHSVSLCGDAAACSTWCLLRSFWSYSGQIWRGSAMSTMKGSSWFQGTVLFLIRLPLIHRGLLDDQFTQLQMHKRVLHNANLDNPFGLKGVTHDNAFFTVRCRMVDVEVWAWVLLPLYILVLRGQLLGLPSSFAQGACDQYIDITYVESAMAKGAGCWLESG